eukprot:15014543-Ditylum_brightwellii.AAC.1
MQEWVTRVKELNRHLKDFPDHNGHPTQPLDADELMDILEFGVPLRWRREFEFCTCLELCVPSEDEPNDEPSLTSKITGKRKAK